MGRVGEGRAMDGGGSDNGGEVRQKQGTTQKKLGEREKRSERKRL